MTDSSGQNIKAAYPGMAATVSGWKTLPNAGDEVLNGTESDIKKARANRVRRAEIAASLADVDAINASRREERERKKTECLNDGKEVPALLEPSGPKELKLVIKADVSGSAEAVEGALQGIGNKEATTKIVTSNVGDVTESDVLMAKAINGMAPTASPFNLTTDPFS
jgi:translation initiation factor IF-2